MTNLITRGLKEAKDGIEGYIAHPERADKGPAVLMIHQHSGLTGYLKTAAYKFASWVTPRWCLICITCSVIPPRPTSTKARRFRIRRRTRTSCASSTAAGAIAYRGTTSMARGSGSLVTAWAGGSVFISQQRRRQRGLRRLLSVGARRAADEVRPRHPCDAAREIKCPSMILYGGHDQHSTFPVQQCVMESFHSNGQSLEWHYFHFGYHGFASTESDGYNPYLADLTWPLVTEFLGRGADRARAVARHSATKRRMAAKNAKGAKF